MKTIYYVLLDAFFSILGATFTVFMLFYVFKFKIDKNLIIDSIVGVGTGAVGYSVKTNFTFIKRVAIDFLVGIVGCVLVLIIFNVFF